MGSRKITAGAIAIAVLVVLAAFAVWFSGVYLEYIKILEIGQRYTSVFFTNIKVRAIAQVIAFVTVFAIFFAGNLWLRRNLKRWDPTGVFPPNRFWFLIVTVAISVIGSSFVGENVYSRIIPAFNPTWFSSADPIFGKNIGYYVFIRPFMLSVTDSLLGIFLLYTVYICVIYAIYYIRNGVRHPRELLEQKGIIAHILSGLLICVVISAVKLTFAAEDILFKQHGEMTGGGYTDIAVWLNFYRLMPYLLLAIVICAIFLLFKGKPKGFVGVILLYPALWIVAAVTALLVQNLIVKPNEAVEERQYIRYNIDSTRAAYNLNAVDELEYPINDNLTPQTVKENTGVLDNIRVTDFSASLTAFNQLQGIRNYYKFKDADIVPYMIKGQKRAVFISARELDLDGIDAKQNLTYVNRRMWFTHGYGVVMCPVNSVTPEGQPDFIMKDIPVKSKGGAPELKQPRIYFGEEDNDWVIVNSYQKELDYAEGQNEIESSYTGTAGIKLTPINRLLFSFWSMDLNMLTSGYISPDSKILTNRNILQRVRTAAPFIEFDSDPYVIIDGNGELKWIIDGYTSTPYYPYSQLIDGSNYIRNSVKAVVDAFNGTVDLYITDQTDPIINTYKKAYPGVFKDGAMPPDIAEHIRYPEKLFKTQSSIYSKYHTTNPATFYTRSDVWDIAREKYGPQSEIKQVEPYYNLMPVDGGSVQLMLMQPYTPANKDSNLVAWLAARSDGENFGKLIAYHFPRGKHVYGTLQIENKIDNDPNISREMTLWSQGGSSVIRGNMLVVPLANSILYVEPIYITSQNQASLPELKRVVLAYRDSVIMEQTLGDALKKMLEAEPAQSAKPEETPEVMPKPQPDWQELVDKAVAKYNEVKQFQKENDYVNYGKSMQEFDELMKEIQQRSLERPAVPAPTPTPTPSPEPTP